LARFIQKGTHRGDERALNVAERMIAQQRCRAGIAQAGIAGVEPGADHLGVVRLSDRACQLEGEAENVLPLGPAIRHPLLDGAGLRNACDLGDRRKPEQSYQLADRSADG